MNSFENSSHLTRTIGPGLINKQKLSRALGRWVPLQFFLSTSNNDLLHVFSGFPGSSVVKNLSVMQEMQVWFLGWKDPLEEGLATHSSILAWEIPCTEEPGGLQSLGSQRVEHNWVPSTHVFSSCYNFSNIFNLRSYKLTCVNLFFKVTGIPLTAKAKFITLQVFRVLNQKFEILLVSKLFATVAEILKRWLLISINSFWTRVIVN